MPLKSLLWTVKAPKQKVHFAVHCRAMPTMKQWNNHRNETSSGVRVRNPDDSWLKSSYAVADPHHIPVANCFYPHHFNPLAQAWFYGPPSRHTFKSAALIPYRRRDPSIPPKVNVTHRSLSDLVPSIMKDDFAITSTRSLAILYFCKRQ